MKRKAFLWGLVGAVVARAQLARTTVPFQAGFDLEAKRQQLYQALRTRVLTDAEMQEALDYGDTLNLQPMTPFAPDEKARELNDAYLQQHRLRLAISGAPDSTPLKQAIDALEKANQMLAKQDKRYIELAEKHLALINYRLKPIPGHCPWDGTKGISAGFLIDDPCPGMDTCTGLAEDVTMTRVLRCPHCGLLLADTEVEP